MLKRGNVMVTDKIHILASAGSNPALATIVAVAQLVPERGERLFVAQKVRGSNPLRHPILTKEGR